MRIIKNFNQILISKHWNSMRRILYVPSQAIKEIVNYLFLSWIKINIIMIDWKKHSYNSISNISKLWLIGFMNSMHFEVHSLTINGMFRSSMEMELKCIKLFTCSINITSHFWWKRINSLSWIEINQRSFSSPSYSNVLLISVNCIHLFLWMENIILEWWSIFLWN